MPHHSTGSKSSLGSSIRNSPATTTDFSLGASCSEINSQHGLSSILTPECGSANSSKNVNSQLHSKSNTLSDATPDAPVHMQQSISAPELAKEVTSTGSQDLTHSFQFADAGVTNEYKALPPLKLRPSPIMSMDDDDSQVGGKWECVCLFVFAVAAQLLCTERESQTEEVERVYLLCSVLRGLIWL